MSKIISGSGPHTGVRSAELIAPTEPQARTPEAEILQAAHIIGQPEGPFGTAAVAQRTVLMRSVGSARFAKFETEEIAPQGLFVVCANPAQFPFQTKSTLLEIQLFLNEPTSPGARIVKALGRIEDIRTAVEVPVPSPAGYVVRLVQMSSEDMQQLDKHLRELLLSTAI